MRNRIERSENPSDASIRSLSDALTRMEDALIEHNIEVVAHTGDAYDPGMRVEVVHGETGADAVVVETIRPTVRIQGQVIQQAQVVTGPGEQSE